MSVGRWTGPHDNEVDNQSRLTRTVPPDRAPFCHLVEHEAGCTLRTRGLVAGSFCDCSASVADQFEDDGR